MSSMCTPTDLNQLKEWNETACRSYLRDEEERANKQMRMSGKIAVLGPSGAGKSRTVNSLREVEDSDPDAALVSSYESTTEIKSYSHPRSPQVTFWDLPGVGTCGYPKEKYLDKINIDQYDFFLLLSCNKFSEDDVWLAQEIAHRKKPYYYVRTKVSFDLNNEIKMKKARGQACSEDDVLNKIRAAIQKGLAELNKTSENVEVFLIDNDKLDKYDFPKLMKTLTDALSSIQTAAVMKSLRTSSMKVVKDKVEELRSQVWKAALAHAVVGGLPIPALGSVVSFAYDVNGYLHQFKWYTNELGLDKTSLEQFSQLSGVEMKVLQSIVDTVTAMFSAGIILQVRKVAVKKAMKDLVKFGVPVVGCVAAGTASYVSHWLLLNQMLDKLEEAAVKVMETALQNHHQQLTAPFKTTSASQPPPAYISSPSI